MADKAGLTTVPMLRRLRTIRGRKHRTARSRKVLAADTSATRMKTKMPSAGALLPLVKNRKVTARAVISGPTTAAPDRVSEVDADEDQHRHDGGRGVLVIEHTAAHSGQMKLRDIRGLMDGETRRHHDAEIADRQKGQNRDAKPPIEFAGGRRQQQHRGGDHKDAGREHEFLRARRWGRATSRD